MATTQRIFLHTLLLGLMALMSACVVRDYGDGERYHERGEGYREGYYDRDHHRYYHDHQWRECMEHDAFCR